MYNFLLSNAIKMKFGSQIRLATEYDLDPTLLSKIINGWRKPTEEYKELLSEALGVPVEHLFNNGDETC